jgi:hypothetical protein
MLAVWSAAFGTDAKTAADVTKAVERRLPTQHGEPTDLAYPELREFLLGLFGERGTLNGKRFGNWLSKREGKIVAGQRFRRAAAPGANGITKWRIERVG